MLSSRKYKVPFKKNEGDLDNCRKKNFFFYFHCNRKLINFCLRHFFARLQVCMYLKSATWDTRYMCVIGMNFYPQTLNFCIYCIYRKVYDFYEFYFYANGGQIDHDKENCYHQYAKGKLPNYPISMFPTTRKSGNAMRAHTCWFSMRVSRWMRDVSASRWNPSDAAPYCLNLFACKYFREAIDRSKSSKKTCWLVHVASPVCCRQTR